MKCRRRRDPAQLQAFLALGVAQPSHQQDGAGQDCAATQKAEVLIRMVAAVLKGVSPL